MADILLSVRKYAEILSDPNKKPADVFDALASDFGLKSWSLKFSTYPFPMGRVTTDYCCATLDGFLVRTPRYDSLSFFDGLGQTQEAAMENLAASLLSDRMTGNFGSPSDQRELCVWDGHEKRYKKAVLAYT